MLNQDFSTDRRVRLTATKQALLERLIQGRPADALKIRRRNESTAPLSFAQHRLWFTEQFEPNSTLYNLSVAVRLVGCLDVVVLERSLNEIIRRHESLRTTFVTVDHKPVQVINSAAPLKLWLEDLSELSEAERQFEIVRLCNEEQKQPFDLTTGPLLRVRLARLSAGEHVVLLTMHHIITDGWSIDVLIKEVAALYTAFVAGRPAPLAELPIQYADFASWQRAWLQEEVLEAQLSYWRRQLTGAPPVVELPTDKPRPAVQTFVGSTHPIILAPDVTENLRALSQHEGVTLFMTLLAGWQLLLHRYLGQDDIVVGTEVANRNRKETEGLIGFFVNQLVLRTKFSSDLTFRELLRRVKDVCLEAYAHQDLPFEKVVEALQPERSLSYSPLYQIVFSLQDAPPLDLELPGLKLELLETENTKAKFDLALGLQDSEGSISGAFDYNTDLYEAETIEQIAKHYQSLLAAIVAEPDAQISRLSFMSAVELEQLQEWGNRKVGEYPREACIHELIEAQVKQQPEATAVESEGEKLSYAELNSRANQVAQELVSLGVRAETVVGIMMERSLEMMVSVLGVLKAGAAYLPLDPAYPIERLSYMAADAGVRVLLSQRRLGVELPGYQGPVVWLDEAREWSGIEKPEVEVSPENLAYVIYTSGSTGQPKATLIPHRAVVSHSWAVKARYRLQPKDRVLQFASLSFDVAVEEIFPTWVSGGCVVLRPAGLLDSHAGAWEFLERREITLVNLPTVYWQELIAERERAGGQALKLRLAAIGGELGLAEKFGKAQEVLGPHVELLNVYGPTETTVTNMAQEFNAAEAGARSVPLGKPIANSQMYVLDRQQRVAPVGVSGELYIGGDCLARGYMNRPELTAEKFVPHPFSELEGERLYRTGDVGRWLSDGRIEFLGRVDEQVKIRGFRIELGEIEAMLSQHPGVRESIVIAREDVPGDKRLVAYVVLDKGENARAELWPSIGEYQIYDEILYYAMTHDERRNRSYQTAIERFVKDKVVVEIGTGKDAILARLCVQAGAKKVYAIEAMEESFIAAQACLKELGLEEKIVLIPGMSFEAQLPEPADVCVSEIIGNIGGSEGAVAALNDARRLLKPGGTMIPQRCGTNIAAVSLPAELSNGGGFAQLPAHYAAKVFEKVGHQFDLRLCIKNFPHSQFISTTGVFEDLDFRSYIQPEHSRDVSLIIQNDARMDGFLLWINLQTVEGELLDPFEHTLNWLPVYLPVFYPGIEVFAGDRIEAVCSTRPSRNGVNPDYQIKGSLIRKDGRRESFCYESRYQSEEYKQGYYERLFSQSGKPSLRAEGVSAKTLRQYLGQHLPEYMIPQAFVTLDQMPLTANGKVDRRKLPVPESEAEREMMVAAATPVEEVLVGIWSEVLGVAVGVEDDFFELGGHSLLATQVVSRARGAFGVEIAMRDLFEGPTVSELATVVERELARGETVPEAPPLRRVERGEELPLSFAQQRLWFIDQLEPGSAAYNVPAAVRLSGDLNLNALEQTLTEVVRRHEVLRTSFKSVEGRPAQVIAEAGKISLPVIDLSQLTEEVREVWIKQFVQEEVEQPFDLSCGPLLRVKLLRSNEREHVLLLTMHHIATDGWSLRVLVNEVAALYEAFINNQPSPLAELPVQYADFAVWQRGWLAGETLEKQLAFWKEQLAGAPAMLELPTDRARPAVQTSRGSTRSFAIRAETVKALKDLSRREDVTFFMTLLAAWNVLLSRYTGQNDLLVGTPIAGRNWRETEDLIGFFVNTLVLRSDLSGNPAFRELLRRVREVCLTAYAHQDLPFEKLVEELQPERSRSHAPVFQVLFSLQNAPVDELSLPGLNLSVLQTEHTTAKFDLSLVMAEEAGELRGALEYNSDLFETVTIERLTSHFENLLEAVISDPDQHILSLPLLSDVERDQLINRPVNSFEQQDLVQLFEAQVQRTPLATALVHEDEQVTYQELNVRANQLANYLQGLGIGPESLVALYLDRSAEMVVAIMAVLKAGAAYLPLDLSSPAERRAFMLQDAGASVLLTQHRFLDDLSPSGSVEIICLDIDQETIEVQSVHNPVSGVRPENLAYVIYTSGSTGQPKGALITHANVTRLLAATRDVFRFDERDVWTLFHSYAFDFSVWELFGPLLSGGRLVVIPYLVSRSPSDFYQLLLREQVTVLNQTPSAFRQLMAVDEEHEQRDELALRFVIFGGEALELQSLAGWFERHPEQPQLVNMYGITETTVHVTVREVTQVDVAQQAGSVIGVAMDDLQLYVLDSRMEPVPVGVAGEMYVGGAGLARGYLNRAALTAEKFVPHSFSEQGGERLYRTGDVGRWLNDGGIEYLGRLDEQVKIRGFRIELGEIEAVLSRHAGVREAVVVVQTVNHDKRLVAYVVAEESLETGELRQYLKGLLPEYMVPQAFAKLERLPLTENGKVDRRALPAVESGDEEREIAVAQTPVEEVLVGIWSEVLGVAVGVEEDFFEVGGHSLLATQVMSRVREAFGVDLALRELFERPTVKELGQSIEREMRQGAGVGAPAIERRERVGELPLSFAQQRLWFIDQLAPGRTVYNIPLSVHLSGELNVMALELTLNEIIKRHEALRTSFAVVDQQPVQVIAPEVNLSLIVEDLTGLPEREREAETVRLADAEAHQPFDLGHGPLLRARLLQLSEREHVVLLTMHHIITDGWSLGVLLREVAVLYQAFAQGAGLPLPELPVQYADFAMWQRERLQGEELERQLSYWRQQLADAPAILELPTDRPRPPLQTFNGAHETFTLSAESTQALHRLSRNKDVTLFMTLLAVWQVLLHRYTGQKDIVVGADVANRNRAETERLIGFFVNMLVLRTNLSGDPTFLELLKRVKEVCLGAYAHQDLPFEKLVEELQPERSLNHSPLFQVLFVLQNAPMGTLELPGLVLSTVERERDEAQFDLILDMQEADGKLNGTLRYNTDLFEADTIKRMVGHFQTLLAAVVADPLQQLSTLPLLTEAEEQQLAEWNHTTSEYPRDTCTHQLFELQVERTPEAVALICEGRKLSYRELNCRANQLAHYLRGMGVGPEVCVGLCMERSIDLIVALLGILKAGGAYVPLDASYPLDRLAFMIEDAQIGILVTIDKMLDSLPAQWGQVVCLDMDAEWIASMSEQNPESEVSAENLAYVMYTSGSTGRPKGVSVVHRSVVRLVQETNYIDFSESDVFLHSAPISFDASTFEVWGSLLNGARLVLLEQQRPTLEGLARTITSNGVTVLWLTAGLFHLMMEEQGAALLPVRRMLAGGDVLAVEQVRKYLAEMKAEGRLINGYGPTENTTFTCCHTMERDSHWQGSVPIGKPVSNSTVFILDQQQRPVPVGVYGEVYAGGDGLARGYLNRAELTAEKFVPHPFSARGGERLYRTGDVGRWLNDGGIEYLGRLDEQVKIRGFRIELGEIEAVLSRHAGVREAVVVVQTVNYDKRLVAYVVAEESLESGELRQYLKGLLPEYMVPQAFVKLERLPLTENGKVDRRALPIAESSGEERELAVAQTPVEEVLVGIWSEVLGVAVGVEEDFFEVGGHSLLATQVMSRVREAFGVELALRELFERPTVKELGQSIEREMRQGAGVGAPAIERRERVGELPLSFAQQRLWFIDQLQPGSAFYNVPSAVRLKGDLNRRALQQTLTEVIRRHEVLRTRFGTVNGRAVQVIEEAAPVELDVVELSELEIEEREARVRESAAQEAALPFDLSSGPLLRVKLLRLGEQEHVVLLTMHHIVMDGWSLGIFIREIATLYEAFIDDKPSPLPELSIQYADFALWQRAYLQGEVLEQQLKYWREQLAEAQTVLQLPADKPRPAIYSYRGADHKFVLPEAFTAPLRKLSQEQGCTLFMTLLAIFKTLLYRHSQQKDILVGTAIANRNRSETEDLIGFFVNTLVLRTDLSGNPSFRDLLQRVRETTIGAYVHQDMPFEKLVEELQPERSLSHAPLFQVAFGVHNTPIQTLTLPGLELSQMDFDFDVGRFDLTLWMLEHKNRLSGIWYYNTDLFEAATIKRLQGRFETILQNVLAQPDTPLSEIEMLTEDEKTQQLVQEQELLASNALVLKTIRRKTISVPQVMTS